MQVRKKGKQEIIMSCFQYAEISRKLKEMHQKKWWPIKNKFKSLVLPLVFHGTITASFIEADKTLCMTHSAAIKD